MRIIWSSFALFCLTQCVVALRGQNFGPCGASICSPAGVNVGIGTSTPLTDVGVTGLQVYGTGVNTGNIVAETTSDGSYVWTKNGANAFFKGFAGSRNNGTWDFFLGQYGLQGGNLAFYTDNGGSLAERMRINSAGNVGIGTTTPQYPLSVNGTVQAKEILVNTGWSDYVFDPGYRLAPLAEVAAYIAANRHLPDLASAAEVAENGVSVGRTQASLLAKVEELTLHMILADEKSSRLEKENIELRKRLERLEALPQKRKR